MSDPDAPEWFDLPLGGVLELPPADPQGLALELHLAPLGRRTAAWWLTQDGTFLTAAEVGEG